MASPAATGGKLALSSYGPGSSSRLGCPEIDSDRAKRARAGCLRSAVEDLGLPGDLEIGETGSDDRRLQLCFQQSAGNSAGPEVDLLFAASGTARLTRMSAI